MWTALETGFWGFVLAHFTLIYKPLNRTSTAPPLALTLEGWGWPAVGHTESRKDAGPSPGCCRSPACNKPSWHRQGFIVITRLEFLLSPRQHTLILRRLWSGCLSRKSPQDSAHVSLRMGRMSPLNAILRSSGRENEINISSGPINCASSECVTCFSGNSKE